MNTNLSAPSDDFQNTSQSFKDKSFCSNNKEDCFNTNNLTQIAPHCNYENENHSHADFVTYLKNFPPDPPPNRTQIKLFGMGV